MESCASLFSLNERTVLLCHLLLFVGSRPCNGQGWTSASVPWRSSFWGSVSRPARSFPLAQSLGLSRLFLLAVCVLRLAGVELVFFHWAVVFGIWAVAVVISTGRYRARSFIYVTGLRQLPAQAI